jgi:hypothetical protein
LWIVVVTKPHVQLWIIKLVFLLFFVIQN